MSIIRLPCTDITHEADNQSKHHRDSSVIVSNERPLLEINVMYSFLNQVVLENTQVPSTPAYFRHYLYYYCTGILDQLLTSRGMSTFPSCLTQDSQVVIPFHKRPERYENSVLSY
jgi:hypothetical protein